MLYYSQEKKNSAGRSVAHYTMYGGQTMTREQAKEHIKGELERYLQQKGIHTQKRFRCLNPHHEDNNPSMGYDRKRNKAHCFACGADYDTLDLIGLEHGIMDGREIFEKAYEVFGIHIDGERIENRNQTKSEQHAKNQKERDYTNYYRQAHQRIQETDYPQKRGLSEEVITRFMLGYDPNYTTGGAIWQALIIPSGKDSYIARNTRPDADKRSRYRKQGKSLIYNSKVLQEAKKPIFVVEGELDALSIATVGGEAVGLGSTANVKSFLKLLESRKPEQPLILALDNDKGGKEAADEVIEGLQKLHLSYYRMNPYGEHKDANDALIADKDALAAAVESAERIEEEALLAEKEAYIQTSTAYHLQSFIDGIADSVNTPYIPTGFGRLDETLDGGLFEGLYIVGAITSLGKTSLLLQIADQIAADGKDVLIFSLEMARSELIAKSVSRHTLIQTLGNGGDIRNAKTARGITTGKRYPHYSAAERELITSSIKAYGTYAEHIYISEGIGDIGADQIRDTVKKHILFTGNKPVVVVDYLQILAPYSDRATDKQNTDKAVLELKRVSRDYKIPVIGISSFNRANYREAVTMEAFKESGAVEYSSDILIGLQLAGAGKKEFDSNAEKKKNPRNIELVILKNRNGKTGDKIALDYYPLFNYFKEQ